MLWHLHMYPPTNIQINSYIPGHPNTILPLSHTTPPPAHPARRVSVNTLPQPSTPPPSLTPKPAHTPSFTFSYSTSIQRRVRMSSETYVAGTISSCASSAPAREPAPWHHQPLGCCLVHPHKQRGMRGATDVYHYHSRVCVCGVPLPHPVYYHNDRHVASTVTGQWVCIWHVVASGEVTHEASGRRKSET